MAYRAFHDELTGLPNRAMLMERLEEAIDRGGAEGGGVVLLYVDLNDFKLVNDSLGHGAGDTVLRQAAKRLRSAIRSSDMLARHGGDEFIILVPSVQDAGDGTGVAARSVAAAIWEQVRLALDEPFTVGEAVFQVGASMGVSVFPDDAESAETLQMHADTAMYRAKAEGTGCAVYEPSAADPLTTLTMAARMRQALAGDEFELHYQPIFQLGPDPRIRGVEALIRWRDPDLGLIPPLDFIPTAERTGVIDAIGEWVLQDLIRQACEWRDEGLMPNFGINVSPRQLRGAAFAARFAAAVTDAGLDIHTFVAELTETSWMLDADKTRPTLDALRGAGVRLAIDDFGSGYSSLARLRDLPVDVIKIDRAFLRSIPEDPQACAIVSAIVELAHACNCDVVAEGIETAEQLEFLVAGGVQLGQGFHLGRPVPADRMTPLLRAHLRSDRRA